MSKIYIAVSKETGQLLTGAKGQAAFLNRSFLGRSMGQTSNRKGTYDVIELDSQELIRTTLNEQEFKIVVRHTEGGMWSGSHVEMEMPKGICDISIGDLHECPEDANLERDLDFVLDIPDMMEAAYKAGLRGDKFVVTYEEEEGEEE
ncbi:hypothetical protein AT278_14360 [Bacillus cereus]|uniref:hypothetical protein n=1 Tax=Bacillus TaxID=1386 RepID=UPI00077AFEF6|nr:MULTISPECIES: hypothetical protein [Bacillus]KAB7675496.1 hypothetical protein GBN91_27425 [Bacillus sp. B1-WWTP-T-0.5-Post-4]KXY57155.1 hypothetical protein AT278_14360 [Bacillus cereus]PGM73071.1 hypothetical protein CN952_10935 [Bacillus cereus]PGN06916.1 hypothetical protein CN954_23855 [Bacillus cereus]HDR4868865.1 hypothetical protein [Bacillus cereus]